MCGIAGCIDRTVDGSDLGSRVRDMTDRLAHRGPDDAGIWLDAAAGVALGHRRLAIRDLSAAGHQPMVSPTGDWVLAFNGEIYNCEDLRAQLPTSLSWRGHSDTEVLLYAICEWGVARALTRTAGMFALAAWNRNTQRLVLARDRLGIKPLYYSLQGDRLLWASELKALSGLREFNAEVDTEALATFLRFGYVAAPRSIFRDTWKLSPGDWLEYDPQRPWTVRVESYWQAADAAATNRARQLGDDELRSGLAEFAPLADIVHDHLVADVDVGAFLSGGIDSSLVTALAQRRLGRPLKTFSVGFDNPSFDEAPHARAVAKALGTDHEEIYLRDTDVERIVPQWSEFYCEPFSDTSGLPTLAVSRLASRQVRVVLTGDGGDELFAGYRRYQQTSVLSARLQRCPVAIRAALGQLLNAAPASVLRSLNPVQQWLRAGTGDGLMESVRKTRSLLSTRSRRQLYECVSSISFNAYLDGPLLNLRECLGRDVEVDDVWRAEWPLLENMQLWDSKCYLPNDILHKVDIASMAVGVEVRVPLLDHRLFEWSWRLPSKWKVREGMGKYVLRHWLRELLPTIDFERTKRGFSAPMNEWLRGPLRDWAESLIGSTHNPGLALFDAQRLVAGWQDFMTGRVGHAKIWPLLVFLDWSQRYLTASRMNLARTP